MIPILVRSLIVVLDGVVGAVARYRHVVAARKLVHLDLVAVLINWLETLSHAYHVVEVGWCRRTGFPLPLGQFVLLNFPLLLARLDVDLETARTILTTANEADECFRPLDVSRSNSNGYVHFEVDVDKKFV